LGKTPQAWILLTEAFVCDGSVRVVFEFVVALGVDRLSEADEHDIVADDSLFGPPVALVSKVCASLVECLRY
jgi:hypothetical protein